MSTGYGTNTETLLFNIKRILKDLGTSGGLATEATLQDVKTSLQLLDNAISGSEMQVDIVAAIPSGTNYIGKVRLTDGTRDGILKAANVLPDPTSDTAQVVTQRDPLPAGENHIGQIGGNTFSLAVTQTTNASAYEAGDAVGGKITITNAMRISGGTGILQSIDLIDKANQKAAMELLIFNSDPTAATITDDTAFVYSTDISKQIARIPIAASDYVTLNSIATVSLGGLSRIVKASGSANLFAALVTTGTPTYTSTSDIIITFGILQD